jgi:hypothetical protein
MADIPLVFIADESNLQIQKHKRYDLRYQGLIKPDLLRVVILNLNHIEVFLEGFLIIYHHLVLKEIHPQNFHNAM